MNNSDEERAVANSLKEIVKHTSRRKGTGLSSGLKTRVVRIAPKSRSGAEDIASASSVPRIEHIADPLLNDEPSHEEKLNSLQNTSAVSILSFSQAWLTLRLEISNA